VVVRRRLLTRVDAADYRGLTVVHQHGGVGALRVDRRNAVDLMSKIRRRVVEHDLHDDGVGGGSAV
jgi:hypothetical protein